MKLMTLLAAVAAMFIFGQSAQARVQHHQHVAQHQGRIHFAERGHHYAVRAHYRRPAGEAYAYAPEETRGTYAEPERGHRATREYRAAGGYGEAYNYGEARGSFSSSRGGYGARPAAWCGWEMRHLVSGDPGPAYNLARNWAHWGHGGPAGVGAVVVWPHHVGKIVGQEGGQWVIESGNDGHAVRTRPRSIGGAIAIRWG